MKPLRIYIGYDRREAHAYDVAEHSLLSRATAPIVTTPLMLSRLESASLLLRPYRIHRGSLWDVLSNAPQSTEFAASRFLTPLLAQTGFALFVDCDVVFLGDVAELFALADPNVAIQVVRHDQHATGIKMDGQIQTDYPRKNWSSVMLFNCDHPGNRKLTLDLINHAPGRDLHRFCWLEDREIGTLPAEWNWLVNVEARPKHPKIAHFTLGGPWLTDWEGTEYDSIWLDAEAHCRSADRAGDARAGEIPVPR